MRPTTCTALAALILGLALSAPSIAQERVTVFEDAPTLDQLRSILVPNSGPGLSRKIEILRPGDNASPSAAAPAPSVSLPPPPVAQSTMPNNVATNAPMAATAKTPEVKPAALPRPPKPAPAAVAFRINFASASDVIPPAYRPHLDRIVELMRQEPKLALTIEGHTDAHGSAEYNLELSKRRAVAVMRYLVGHGIDASRLVAVGKGKTSPLVADPFDGRNRRVQFVNGGEQSGT